MRTSKGQVASFSVEGVFGRRISLLIVFMAALLGGLEGPAGASSPHPRSVVDRVATSSFTVLDPVRVLGANEPVQLVGGRVQYLTVAGRHGAPRDVSAARVVVTVAPSVSGLEVRVHASGSPVPLVPTLMAGAAGEPVVRSITVPVGANGKVEFRPSEAGLMTVDLVGVYVPSTSTRSGRFVPVDSLFVSETADGRLVEVALPPLVPTDAVAVVLHLTAWNSLSRGTWSVDGFPAVVTVPGRISSNEVLVRPSAGRIRLSGSSTGRMAIDLVGWFTGPSAAEGSDGLFVVAPPSRVVDTTSTPNPLGAGVALHAGWTLETSSSVRSASSLVVRVGTTGAHDAGSVSVYAAGRPRPTNGQVNNAGPGAVSVVQVTSAVSTRGLAAHSSRGTDLSIDVIGYFTGVPSSATAPHPVNIMPAPERFPGLLAIPSIKVATWVLDDTSLVDIDPSHLRESRSPNQPGNTAIFGHRTSKGREFRNIDRLRIGDPIHLVVQGRLYVYATTAVAILDPNDPRLYASFSSDQTLTLVACHPPGSVKQRVVVFARLVNVTAS